jgi:hypothetical protein
VAEEEVVSELPEETPALDTLREPCELGLTVELATAEACLADEKLGNSAELCVKLVCVVGLVVAEFSVESFALDSAVGRACVCKRADVEDV